jgi:hypothetical protein
MARDTTQADLFQEAIDGAARRSLAHEDDTRLESLIAAGGHADG